MNFDLADGIRMVDEVTKVGFRIKGSPAILFLKSMSEKVGSDIQRL